MKITHIELHLNSDTAFVSKFGKKVKQAGGKYTHVRGYSEKRYVTMPIDKLSLIDELAISFPCHKKTTGIVRGGDATRLPSNVVVHYIPNGTKSAFCYIMQKFSSVLARHEEAGK
jgi:hypothetical protein